MYSVKGDLAISNINVENSNISVNSKIQGKCSKKTTTKAIYGNPKAAKSPPETFLVSECDRTTVAPHLLQTHGAISEQVKFPTPLALCVHSFILKHNDLGNLRRFLPSN